ncbi:MAG TPA: VOC family protein [Terriglobales bacterium]|jgi:catechol 2,3-dioxygenase-like lactoylglutathione lyase family enzyme
MPDAYRIPALSMVMLGVRNVNDSLLFYRDKLGMAVKQHFEGFAFLDAGAVMLILSEALAKNSPHTAGAVEVIFNVDAVNDHHNSLQNLGVEFLHTPHNVNGPMWAANFRDPDGHLLTLFGPEKKS